MISASQAVTNGTTKNATTISKTLNQAESTSINLNALIGPTIPIKPNPADSFVPWIPTNADTKPDTMAVVNIGNIRIGYFTILGIIILTPPKKTDNGTPKRFTLLVPIINTASVAEIPIDADPAAKPVIPIAKAMATVDSGEIIIRLNTIEIKILMTIGCNSVKPLTILPMAVVIIFVYGNIKTPIAPEIRQQLLGIQSMPYYLHDVE